MTAYPKKRTLKDSGKKKRKTKPSRKSLEKKLERIVKDIIFWRDGLECVEKALDGSKCRPGVQWGHVVPQIKSPMLVHNLGNVFPQCPNHNFLHHQKDPMYNNWYVQRWGNTAFSMLCQFMREHVGQKYTIPELQERIKEYAVLYENRFFCEYNEKELVSTGYYGDIIRQAWLREGK